MRRKSTLPRSMHNATLALLGVPIQACLWDLTGNSVKACTPQAEAAPATVSGEPVPMCHLPTRQGRRDKALIREPGDLPGKGTE